MRSKDLKSKIITTSVMKVAEQLITWMIAVNQLMGWEALLKEKVTTCPYPNVYWSDLFHVSICHKTGITRVYQRYFAPSSVYSILFLLNLHDHATGAQMSISGRMKGISIADNSKLEACEENTYVKPSGQSQFYLNMIFKSRQLSHALFLFLYFSFLFRYAPRFFSSSVPFCKKHYDQISQDVSVATIENF